MTDGFAKILLSTGPLAAKSSVLGRVACLMTKAWTSVQYHYDYSPIAVCLIDGCQGQLD